MCDEQPVFDTSGMQELAFEDIRDLCITNGLVKFTLYAERVIPGSGRVWVPVAPLSAPLSCFAAMRAKVLDLIAKEPTIAPISGEGVPALRH